MFRVSGFGLRVWRNVWRSDLDARGCGGEDLDARRGLVLDELHQVLVLLRLLQPAHRVRDTSVIEGVWPNTQVYGRIGCTVECRCMVE